MLLSRLPILLGAHVLFSGVVQAAEVTLVNDSRCMAVLTGDIEQGDVQRVSEVVPSGATICLDSRGGNYLEGRYLFNFFLENGIATFVTAESQCQSACAVAFLGGSLWGDFRYSSRTMEPGAYVAFHAPFLELPEGTYTASDMSSAVSGAVGVVGDIAAQRRSLMITDQFLTQFLLFNDPTTKLIATVEEAAHGGVILNAPPQAVMDTFESRSKACHLMFELFGDDFDNGQAAWTPYFPPEPSEFSRMVDLGAVDFQGQKWSAVGADHDWETPWLNSGCAFPSVPASDADGQEILMWAAEKTDALGGPTDAVQVMRRYAKWWYFLGASTELTSIQK